MSFYLTVLAFLSARASGFVIRRSTHDLHRRALSARQVSFFGLDCEASYDLTSRLRVHSQELSGGAPWHWLSVYASCTIK